LGDLYSIRNGIATLKNDLYIFTPIDETDEYYILQYNNKPFYIEKGICKDIIKPNVIKTEEDLFKKTEKVIFPYRKIDDSYEIIEEVALISTYPRTYEYFCYIRSELEQRDKGKREYPQWYAFGRTQGINNYGKKILIPYMAKEAVAVLDKNVNNLFYCGYAIFIDDDDELEIIKKILISDIFWYYVKNTSKHYSSGYMSLAKNYIKGFGVPKFTEEQKKELLSMGTKNDVNKYLIEIYNLTNL